MAEVISPKEDIAEKEVLSIESASTEIKEVLTEGIAKNVPYKDIEKEMQSIISKHREKIKQYPRLLKIYNNAMSVAYKKWSSYFIRNIRTLNVQTQKQLSNIGIVMPTLDISDNNPDKFRQVVRKNERGLVIINKYQKKVQAEIRRLAQDNPVAVFTDKNGNVRKRSLRNEAEIEVRLEANRKDVEKLKETDKFVITSTHADCSPRCEVWQGRLFSTDGTTGNKDGMRYVPLEDAMEGVNGDGNGIISGYNCRHRAISYKSGMKPPRDFTDAEIKRQREVDRKQRYHERRIRQMKLEERLNIRGGDEDRANVLRERYENETRKYQAFSLRNQRSFSKWRTEIIEEGE